jgi:hypothetical protein
MDSFLITPSDHSHTPNPNRLLLIRLQNQIKERGAASGEATSTILHNVLRTIPLNIAAELPSTSALSQTIRRQRVAPALAVNGKLPSILRETDRGEEFVFFENESMIIFTCNSNLSVLKECKHWFVDGTFSVSMTTSVRLLYVSSVGVSRKFLPAFYSTWPIHVTDHTISVRFARGKEDYRL